jgi:signal transduction histidine kinase
MPTPPLDAIVAAGIEIAQSDLQLDALLELVAVRAREVTRAYAAAVELIEGDELVYRGCAGGLSNTRGARIKIAGSLSGRAMAGRVVLYSPDTRTDLRVDRDACARLGVASMAVAPLYRAGQAIGVLKISSNQPRAFSERDFAALSLLSQSIGASLQRQMMLEAVEEALAKRTAALAEAEAARRLAERAMAVKAEFLANMSHELRTPLTSIIGFAGLLQASDGLDPKHGRFVERISTASHVLLALINDVLDYSKLEEGAVALEAQPFDVRELIAGAADLIGAQAGQKGLGLSVDITPSAGRLIGDAGRLRQVLLNLIGNAVKFTEAGGVEVRARTRRRRGGVELRCEVADTGPGVAPDRVEHLFERFVQADSSIARRYGGAGLGLAISRRLIELMGGEIGIESELGRGSTFWFRLVLPAESAERRAA